MSDQLIPNNPQHLISQLQDFLVTAKQLKLIPLIAVVGPTASGKTALGIALAQAFEGEIISADSRQIYQEMNIGTASPTALERQSAKHYLVDIIRPNQSFTLSDYQKLANQTITEIHNHHKIPILVGGTGLYINSITQNYLLPDSKPDQLLRSELEILAGKKGNEAVHNILKNLDPNSAAQIHPNNLRYVIRAIEIAKQTNQPKTSKTDTSPYLTFFITIDWPRAELYNRINRRIDEQISAGFIDETKNLLLKYPEYPPALSSLGYKEIREFINGNCSLDFALEEFKKHTRNYAKRQLTWFRKIKPLYSILGKDLSNQIAEILKNKF